MNNMSSTRIINQRGLELFKSTTQFNVFLTFATTQTKPLAYTIIWGVTLCFIYTAIYVSIDIKQNKSILQNGFQNI